MVYTTIDIDDLKHVKLAALNRDITLRELVNRAISGYLGAQNKSSESAVGGSGDREVGE